ncbi:hypothetical protein RJI07_08630 [Mycoplasmatota bacterium WC30]
MLHVNMTPVMYSDITGMSPERINVFKLVIAGIVAVGAITVGVLALTTSIVTLPLMASIFLICAGPSALMDMVAIGRAQYNYSVDNGREGREISDDVINAIGSNSLDRALYHATMRMVYITADQGLGSAIALLMEAKNPAKMVSYTKGLNGILWITVLTTAYRAY